MSGQENRAFSRSIIRYFIRIIRLILNNSSSNRTVFATAILSKYKQDNN